MSAGRHKVLWTRNATLDLEELIEYISEDNQSSALKIFLEIKAKCDKLSRQPEKCRVLPELREIGVLNYRELIVGNYRIFYKLEDKTIYIISVVDGRRDMEAFLFNRLIREG